LQAFFAALAALLGTVGDASAQPSQQPGGADVPVVIRLQGLALGTSLRLRRAGVDYRLSLNEPRALGSALPGSPLQLQIIEQPEGQYCELTETATTVVPADSAPVFLRCRHLPADQLVMPAAVPEQSLELWRGDGGMRSRAYPGIRYESRVGVRGGRFPYEFRLLAVRFNGQTIGLDAADLDFRRGSLSLRPEAEGAYEFDLQVRDSANPPRQLDFTHGLEVAAADFLFVSPDGQDATGRGGIDAPFRSVAFALTQSSAQQLLMLRAGRHVGRFAIDGVRSRSVLGFPGELAQIDLEHAGPISVLVNSGEPVRFENLDIGAVSQYGIAADPASSGLVLRHLRFTDGREGSSPNENPAFVHTRGHGASTIRHRLLVQDNDFGNFQMSSSGAYAMTLYDVGDSLVENNQIRLGAVTGGIHDKDNSQRNTYRENYIEFSAANANRNGIQVSAQANSERVHIHHNLLINSGLRLGLQCFQQTCTMRDHDVHHNTLVDAGITFGWGAFNPNSGGTRIRHNLIRSEDAPYAWHSCLGNLPANLVAQLSAATNRLETAHPLAMRDTECSGSPMNVGWASWRDGLGLDAEASGSVVSAASALQGSGALTRLPSGDPRLSVIGHRYPLPSASASLLFENGFEPGSP
jgi:hypothetical protein